MTRGPEEADKDSEGLEELLAAIRDERGFDFSGYKRASLTRRIQKRMATVGVGDFARYRQFLAEHPEEFVSLFNTILINVTAFLRDREAWDYLAEHVLGRLAAAKEPNEPIRAWCAGVASGEEVYSLAVLLCDVLGETRFRESAKIYGTDADEEALAQARQGRYTASSLEAAFSAGQISRYFERGENAMTFRSDLRRALIFGRHDLVRDPPISRVDLLVCRNTLMYFNADVQRRILASFQFALNPGGFLFLGKSEALVTRTNLFATEDLSHHIFVKGGGTPRLTVSMASTELTAAPALSVPIVDAAFEASPLAQLILDGDGTLRQVNRRARQFFSLGAPQIGRPFRELELSYQPVDLRSRIDSVIRERRAITVPDVDRILQSGATETLAIHIVPVVVGGSVVAVTLTFEEVSRYKLLQDELALAQRKLESAYEELQSTVEELETTNEELQSTNEELETTNEELHSTNEELETMNEELQSTNEELETINNELRARSIELDELSSFLQAILSSLRSGVVVLNPAFGVRVWNREAENLWGLRAEEVEGQHFLNLDIGLPVQELREPIRTCLSERSEAVSIVVRAVNRRGRAFDCAVALFPLRREDAALDGVILVMQEASGSADATSG